MATGNAFASTRDSDDVDFANYGVQMENYEYFNGNGVEVPDDYTGISTIEQAVQNSCLQEYCAPPCLSLGDIVTLTDAYEEQSDQYEEATEGSKWKDARRKWRV